MKKYKLKHYDTTVINVSKLFKEIDIIKIKNNLVESDKMFTKDELLVIEDALKIADAEYIRLIDENKNNKNRMVAYNRKQKKLWLVQNKLKKLIKENENT